MHSPLTEHARTRMQQRGITPAAFELLLDDVVLAVGHRYR